MLKHFFLLNLISIVPLFGALSINKTKYSDRNTTLNILNSENFTKINALLQCELKCKQKKIKQDTLLHLAVETGKFKVVKHLVEKTSVQSRTNKFLIIKGKHGNNILSRACMCGHEDIVRYLLENHPFKKGSLIERQFLYNKQAGEPNKSSAENIAREHNFANIAQLVANHTKSVKRNEHKPIGHITKQAEDPPLHIAIKNEDIEGLKECIKNTYNNSGTYKSLLSKGIYGYNVLGRAAFHGDINIVRYLLTQCPFGKDTKIRAQYFNNHSSGISNRYSAESIAQARGHINIAQLIKSHSPKSTTSSSSSTTTNQVLVGTQTSTKIRNFTFARGRGQSLKKSSRSSTSRRQKQTINEDEPRSKKRERKESQTTATSTSPQSNNKRQQTMHPKDIAQIIAFENVSQLLCFQDAIISEAPRQSMATNMKDDAKDCDLNDFDFEAFEAFLNGQNKDSFYLG